MKVLFYLQYAFLRVRRAYIGSAVMFLMVLLMVVVLQERSITLQKYTATVEEIMTTQVVTCNVLNPGGEQKKAITYDIVTLCTKSQRGLADYIEEIYLKWSVPGVVEELVDKIELCAVSAEEADSRLGELGNGKINWDGGATEAIFLGEERVCAVSEKLLADLELSIGDTLEVIVTVIVRNEEVSLRIPMEIIAGVSGVAENIVYCPFYLLTGTVYNSGGYPSVDAVSFTIKDNYRIAEFRKKASDFFNVDNKKVFTDDRIPILIINDGILNSVVSSVNQSISLLRLLIPILLVISMLAAFFVSFLFAQRRKNELVLMVSQGMSRTGVFICCGIEYSFLAFAGVCCGILVSYIIWKEPPNVFVDALLFIVALLGNMAALCIPVFSNLAVMQRKER